ncbi:MAG: dihydropteroate synthase, partial [Bacteroidota bacterium]
PQVMGILNLTPDSFSDGGEFQELTQAFRHAEAMLQAGASIIDIGGFSSRPKATVVSEQEELDRIYTITEGLITRFPEALISVDTYRPEVAKQMLDLGVHIINDISAGRGLTSDEATDSGMIDLLAQYKDVPYIMMHMQGTPQTMQDQPSYENVVTEVVDFFVGRLKMAQKAGLKDVVLDPGFGFGKSILHNYQLWAGLDQFRWLDQPLLVGISRKSMMYRLFDTHPKDVLDLSSVLHFKAIEKGAHLLRVHDVKEAVRVVALHQFLSTNGVI